jgi:hypothetical protein
MTSREMSRRVFLARIGVLGAGAAILPQCTVGPGGGALETEAIDLGRLIELLRPVLADLSRDTLNGFVAFSVPGRDPYSTAQGTPRGHAGGIEAGGTDFLIDNLDRFLPFPDDLLRPAASALVAALRDLPLPLPLPLPIPLPLPGGVLGDVEEALLFILANDDTVPLSLPVALLLNYVGTVADPLSLEGPFLSPFARLSFADKARAMEMIEATNPDLVALLDANVPEPLRASVSGLLRFLGGALHEFAAFGCFGESQVYDPGSRTLTGRPVGWQLSGYLPDNQTGDGWDDFLGYYQDRREVPDA